MVHHKGGDCCCCSFLSNLGHPGLVGLLRRGGVGQLLHELRAEELSPAAAEVEPRDEAFWGGVEGGGEVWQCSTQPTTRVGCKMEAW